VLRNPANRHKAIALTFEQFQYGWANNLDEAEARISTTPTTLPRPENPSFEAGFANFMLVGTPAWMLRRCLRFDVLGVV